MHFKFIEISKKKSLQIDFLFVVLCYDNNHIYFRFVVKKIIQLQIQDDKRLVYYLFISIFIHFTIYFVSFRFVTQIQTIHFFTQGASFRILFVLAFFYIIFYYFSCTHRIFFSLIFFCCYYLDTLLIQRANFSVLFCYFLFVLF